MDGRLLRIASHPRFCLVLRAGSVCEPNQSGLLLSLSVFALEPNQHTADLKSKPPTPCKLLCTVSRSKLHTNVAPGA